LKKRNQAISALKEVVEMSDSDISGIINIVKSKIRKWTCQL
jgi:hypothetical protein